MRFRFGKAKSVWRFLSFVAGLGLAHGQTPTSPVTPSTLNTAYLEHLVKAQIDSMRRAKDLPALVSDSVLYVSAKDHVGYLAGQPTTSVNQKQNNKRTAQDRAYFHGGRNYLVDENVLSFPLGKTYIETARRIAQTWSRSGRAMRNITETDFQVTGVAIAPHPQDGRFIVVQDFARVLWKYTFANNPRLFPYDTVRRRHAELFAEAPGGGKQKLPWKLKPLDYKRTHKNSIWQSFRKEKLHLQSDYANRVIFARSLTPMEMLQAMQNRRDGLAVELVDFNSYNCNSSTYYTAASRRNGASSVNGRVLKPVYKQELLQNLRKQKRAFRKDKAKRQRQLWFDFSAKARREKQKLRKETWKPEYTSVPVGSLMNVDSSGYVVANFLLLHKKRIIGAVHYTDVCGDLSFTDSVAFEPRLPQHQLNFKDDDRTFEFRVPFARNQAVPDHQVMLAIRDTLRNHQIDQITINAFASVEGMGGLNEKLYRQRADSIVGYLRRYIDEHTDIDVRTGENWTMFYQQIADSASHPWKDLATDQIKRELQKPEVLQAWEARLAEQRQAHVRLETHLQVRDTLAYVRKYYKAKNPIQAAALQRFYYEQWQQGRIPADSLFTVHYPATSQYSDLVYNQMLLDYRVNHVRWSPNEWQRHWDAIKKSLENRNSGIETRYYAVAFMLSEWEFAREQGFKADNLFKLISQVTQVETYKSQERKLKAMFYLRTLPGYQSEGNYRRLRDGVQYLLAYYRDQPAVTADAKRTLSFANYLIEVEAFKAASQVLDTYLKKTGFDEEVYAQYLKLVFIHPDYQKKRSYTKLLIEASRKLSPARWCDLFIGECRINFQVFDDADLRNLYCEKCANSASLPVTSR